MNPTTGPVDLSAQLNRRTMLALGGIALGAATVGLGAVERAHALVSTPGGMVYPTDPWSYHGTGGTAYLDPRPNGRKHMGIDSQGGVNQPIFSVLPGRVVGGTWGTTAGDGHGWGNNVLIDHGDGIATRYAHFSTPPLVGLGATVQMGQQIGTMGGSANGNLTALARHLHFEVYRNGTNVSPIDFLNNGAGPTMPVGPFRVREVRAGSNGWVALDTGIETMSNVFSAVDMGTGYGDLVFSEGGYLHVVGVRNGAWTKQNSGLPLNATSISAVNVGQPWPHVFAIENDRLFHIAADSVNGWQKWNTGLQINGGKISAVQIPGVGVQIMAKQSSDLYQITTSNGWQIGGTGQIVGDQFKAVYMGGGVPQVMTFLNNEIQQIWAGAGWERQSTGVLGTGSMSAVNMGGGSPQVISNEGWNVTITAVQGGGWVRQGTGVGVTGAIDAVRLGTDAFPLIYAVG